MNNILKDYTNLVTEQFNFFGKQILDKYYISSIFNSLVEEYILVRYYNAYPTKSDLKSTINYYLNQNAKDLKENNPTKNKNIDFMLHIFAYLIYLDTDLTAENINKLEKEITIFREKNYEIFGKIEFSKEYRNFRKRKNEYIKNYQTSDFNIEFTKIKNKKLYDTKLNYTIKLPELYSEKAIELVYNSGIISEDKLFVQYNLIAIKVLEEILIYDYKTNYLVEFNIELFNKKEKLNRLLKIIDNDITKEKISFKISYTNYLDNKEEIFDLIRNGYNFSIIKDENYKEDEYNNLFKYILDKEV